MSCQRALWTWSEINNRWVHWVLQQQQWRRRQKTAPSRCTWPCSKPFQFQRSTKMFQINQWQRKIEETFWQRKCSSAHREFQAEEGVNIVFIDTLLIINKYRPWRHSNLVLAFWGPLVAWFNDLKINVSRNYRAHLSCQWQTFHAMSSFQKAKVVLVFVEEQIENRPIEIDFWELICATFQKGIMRMATLTWFWNNYRQDKSVSSYRTMLLYLTIDQKGDEHPTAAIQST